MSNPLSSEQQFVFENEVLKVIESNPKFAKVTPQTALRFYRDRKFNAKQTIAYIEKDIKWREQMDIDSINVSHVHEQLRTGKFIFTGAVDKKNRPIILFNAAKHDPKVDFFKTLTLAAYAFELAIKSMPEGIEELVIVENLDGFKTDNADNRMVKYLLEISQSHYPGRIAKFYAVNAPWYYKVVYKVVKPWLSEELLNKISIESDTSRLKQDVDISLLPKELGGSDAFDIDSWINQRAQIENVSLETPTPLNVAPEILATFSDIAAKDLIPSSRKHGWIKKQGGYVKTFNKRYSVLTDFILYYFREENDPKPEGFVELQGARITMKKGNVFEIITAVDKVCIFSVKSDKEFKEWTADITTAINDLSVTPN